jgi:Flp pilus assembly protein TadG
VSIFLKDVTMRLRAHLHKRRGAAVVELAVLLPLLCFLFVAGVDFARVYYHQITVANAASSGALYGARDDFRAADTEGIKQAALADAKNLTPAPTVTSVTGLDALEHPCVNVTVTWTFSTVSRYPFIPSTIELSRTVQMRVAPTQPKELAAPAP